MPMRSFLPALILFASTSMAVAVGEIPVPADYVPPFVPEDQSLTGLVITIDPGHGGSSFSEGYHGSARGVNSRVVEGDLNMAVSGLVYHHLKDAGARVHLTRRDDRKITLGPTGRAEELGARTAMAERTRSHLFLSLHHNSAPRATADGVVILIWPTDKAGGEQPLEIAFADILRDELKKTVHQKEHFSHYEVDHPLASGTDIPSAVAEFGFLSNADFDAWVTRPTAHKEEAIGVYNAVVRMWTEHREELEALNEKLFPREDSAKEPEADASLFPLGRPSSRIWPFSRHLETEAEARHLIETFRAQHLTDRTTYYLDASVGREGDDWILTGRSNFARVASGLERELSRALGRSIRNEMEVLPSDRLMGRLHGVVQVPMALTWGAPEEGRSVQTQLLLGEPLFLLDINEDETYLLVQGVDGYTGWVRSDAVAPLGAEEFIRYANVTPLARVTRDIMLGDFRVPPGAVVPYEVREEGALISIHQSGTGPWGERTTQRITNWPDRDPFVVETEWLRPMQSGPGVAAAETAMSMLYAPYIFGGRSSQGLDCSGLVGVAWAAAGVQLPRDANQQALVGRLVATNWQEEGMLPGDMLFFIDETGRVIHTGISLGGKRFIHASPPEVQINSLDPEDALYSEGWHRAFSIARRPGE